MNLRLGLRALEKGELGRANLLDALLALRGVDLALVAGDRELLSRSFRLHVLPEVVVHASAFDDDRLDRDHPVAAADRAHGVVNELLFRRLGSAAGRNKE